MVSPFPAAWIMVMDTLFSRRTCIVSQWPPVMETLRRLPSPPSDWSSSRTPGVGAGTGSVPVQITVAWFSSGFPAAIFTCFHWFSLPAKYTVVRLVQSLNVSRSISVRLAGR